MLPANITRELLARHAADQAMRARMRLDREAYDPESDRENGEWLRATIACTGWPHPEHNAPQVMNAAWIIAQHSDFDPILQAHLLQEISKIPHQSLRGNIAFLTDRIAMNEDRAQTYGTQFRRRNGIVEPWPVVDPGSVDERRRVMGLGPPADYAQEMEAIFAGMARHSA